MLLRSHQDLLKGIYDMGFSKPSKIQERALPLLLSNPYAYISLLHETLLSFVIVHKT